jgi:hydroxyacylglutathione hydrolase
MKQVQPDLWQTVVEHPFPQLNTHAYFLTRKHGNALLYNTSHARELDHMANLGGLACQYLSHRHEAGPSLVAIRERFGATLCADAAEAPAIGKFCQVDTVFDGPQIHGGDIEVIPTPGHTAGGVCYLYDSPHGGRYLFTGDTLYLSHGHWNTLVMPSDGGSHDKLITSLGTLRVLEPDWVLCSASEGDHAVAAVTKSEWQATIDHNIKQLMRHE